MTGTDLPGPGRSPAAEGAERYVRVVLLGFMASGKTVVGRRLASRLGWRHVDLDREIEARSGRRIRQIFENEGEEAFRRLEVEISPDFTALEKIVISPGGGWITNPGIFEALPSGTLTVWLKVSPQEVARRLANSFGQNVRPLLSGSDPRARIEALLAEREPLYRRAAVTVDTEARRIDEIVQEIASIIQGGTPPPRSA